jgi:proteasome lid subunit RPN8/RPN11
VSFNARATNEYADRKYLAYCVNVFINPILGQFFNLKNIDIDEDGYALSEMIQWIWRSAIRKGEDIYIYIPSSRMRNLLKEWLNILCVK